MITTDKVIEIFCIADVFVQNMRMKSGITNFKQVT